MTHTLTRAVAAGAVALGLAAAPAVAQASTVHGDLNQLRSSLATLTKDAHASKHAAAARKALKAAGAATIQAADDAASQLTSSGPAAEASALAQVAPQMASELGTVASLIPSASSSLRPQLANSVDALLGEQTVITSMLADLTGEVSASQAPNTLGSTGLMVEATSSELSQLSKLVNAGSLPAGVRGTLQRSFTAAGASIDAIVAQLQNLVPGLPAQVQPYATQLLTQLESVLRQAAVTMSSTSSSSFSGSLASQLQSVESWLGQLFTSIATGKPSGYTGGSVSLSGLFPASTNSLFGLSLPFGL